MYTSFDETRLEKIVRLLKSHKFEFLSGEQLSRSLNLSRAAVWKYIKKLQSLGYKIQTRQNLGYKLLAKPELLLPWEVADGLQTEIFGRKIYYFDTIDSTQSFALRLASKPYENGSIVIAERQTRGKGRLNRRWISPKGGIWLSILLKPDFEVSYVSLFPIITSLALAKAIEKVLKLKPRLKWPNDVTLNNKKVAGILIEASIETNKIDYLIIGVGMNFRIQPKMVSRLLKNSENFYGITTLVGKNKESDPVELLQKFLYELEQLYRKILSGNLKEIRNEWIKKSSTIGKNVTISTPTGLVKGKAVSIDENGALLLSRKGKIRCLLVGDVSH
ncbi:MAG: biotin--[acetyl-CoA-carboxylase] ligase [Thaumarchaeota archaeon 13_1_40CM_4_38_7]|nr:MAG: biotin--[acetyl-CoA-carboxylase] ligase [Thaumarchaeota archaeon 13_1_40CM_4_38_7]OLC93768.1 MAG: biotin--[acetyl-CoA-carboxylase] ligase [Thaumarchaeota archaeon 13_1_40CM_3_38_6]